MKIRFQLIIILLLTCTSLFASQTILKKPQNSKVFAYSGDNQTQNTGKIIANPIRVLVTDKNGNPLKKHEVSFTIISFPKNAKGFKLDTKTVCTDSRGIAEN